jgi:hypothetical protein
MYVPNAISYSVCSFNDQEIENSAFPIVNTGWNPAGKQQNNPLAARPTICCQTTVYDSGFLEIAKEFVHKWLFRASSKLHRASLLSPAQGYMKIHWV